MDLTVPGLNFVFGLADPARGAAVISLARLYPEFYGQPRDPRRFKERAVKEAVHELGHLLGLGHCPDPACVMSFSNSLADTDRRVRDSARPAGICCQKNLEGKPGKKWPGLIPIGVPRTLLVEGPMYPPSGSTRQENPTGASFIPNSRQKNIFCHSERSEESLF